MGENQGKKIKKRKKISKNEHTKIAKIFLLYNAEKY